MAKKSSKNQGDAPLSSPHQTKMSKAERRDAVRVEAKNQREAAIRKQKRNTRFMIFGSVGLVLALVVGVYGIFVSQQRPDLTASAVGSAPKGGMIYASEDKNADDLVLVTVYSDYMCPFCGEFERANGAMLEEYASEGKIAIDYHPVAFLDRFSNGTKFSTRGSAAARAVGDLEIAKLPAFNHAIFSNQPEENSPGLSDETIASLARDAGVAESTIATFKDKKYTDAATTGSDQAITDGVESTPSIKIDGEKYELTNQDIDGGTGFKTALDAAISKRG